MLRLDKKEKRVLGLFILLLSAILLIPCIYGYFICPKDHFFLGLLGVNGSDDCFYLGWGAKQAAKGYLLFEDKFNGFVERRLVFNPHWLLMGWFSRLTDISILVTFHIQRVLSSILLVLIAYRLISEFLQNKNQRIFAVILVVFSSGIKILSAESNVFYSMMFEVNLPLAIAMFFLVMYLGYKTFFIHSKHAWITGLATLVLGMVYPYAVISTYFILGACAIFQFYQKEKHRKYLTSFIKVFLVSLPIVLYDAYQVLTDWKLTVGQASFTSPNPIKYFVIGLGPAALVAFYGLWLVIKNKKTEYYFIAVWFVVTCIQIYTPVALIPFQVQLILGIQLPLAILATYGFWVLKKKWFSTWSGKKAMALGILVIVLSSPFNLYYYFETFKKLNHFSLPEYMNLNDKKAIDWLAENTSDTSVVVASTTIAPYIPVLANNRVYCSDYWAPTANYFEKAKQINWLFSEDSVKTDIEIDRFLETNRIDYLFYDENLYRIGGERMLNDFRKAPFLDLVFENPAVRIFKKR